MNFARWGRYRIKNRLVREGLAEFLGTCILVLFGDGSVAQYVLSRGTLGSADAIHWSWGIGVTMGVYVSGGVSGGHINPSVTVALACVGKFPWRKVPFYILAQYLGGFTASALLYGVYHDALDNLDGGIRHVDGVNGTAGIWSTYPQTFATLSTVLGDQVLGTALLLVLVLAITDDRNLNPPRGLLPISIGLIVVGIGMAFHLNCGYAINPARDLAPRIFTAIAGWGTEPFSFRDYQWFWVPVLGPHVGAIIGACVYELLIDIHWPDEYTVTTPTEKRGKTNDIAGNYTSFRRFENRVLR
ncbi:hypothetical protein ScPMuIL_017579 [Solemya velum]